MKNEPITLEQIKAVVLEYAEKCGWTKGVVKFHFTTESQHVEAYHEIKKKSKQTVITTEERL